MPDRPKRFPQDSPLSDAPCECLLRQPPEAVGQICSNIVSRIRSTPTESGPAALSPEDLAWLWSLARRLHACDDVAAAEDVAAEARAELGRRGGAALATALADTLGPALAAIRGRDRLRTLVLRDPLTGLANRRVLEEELPGQIARAAERQTPLAVAMLDLDRFRDFNERHGHPAGDIMLQSFGILLQGFRREDDVACRYGGEEFLLLMPATPTAAAAEKLEGLRAALAETLVHHEGRRLEPVTASIGLAGYPAHGRSGPELLRAADAALYRAKRAGRNRLILAASPDPAG
jgi:diguanylate cyclase (GGDEF)-like protein